MLKAAPVGGGVSGRVEAQVLALRNPVDASRCFESEGLSLEEKEKQNEDAASPSRKRRAASPTAAKTSQKAAEDAFSLAREERLAEGVHPSGRAAFCLPPECLIERKADANGPPMLDCTYSPTGELLAFVEGRDLFVALPESGRKFRVTSTREGVSCGLAEYIAQEEMNRMQGYWWYAFGGQEWRVDYGAWGDSASRCASPSRVAFANPRAQEPKAALWVTPCRSPCGRYLAFAEFEESHIPPLKLQRARLPPQQTDASSEGASKFVLEKAAPTLPSAKDAWQEAGLAASFSPSSLHVDKEAEKEKKLKDAAKTDAPDGGATANCNDGPSGGCFSLANEEHRFPFAGRENVKIRLCISEVRLALACFSRGDFDSLAPAAGLVLSPRKVSA